MGFSPYVIWVQSVGVIGMLEGGDPSDDGQSVVAWMAFLYYMLACSRKRGNSIVIAKSAAAFLNMSLFCKGFLCTFVLLKGRSDSY